MIKNAILIAAAALSLTGGALSVSSPAQAGYDGWNGGYRPIYRPAFVPVYRPVVQVYQVPVYRPVYQAPAYRPTYGGWHCW